jgi:hypothetical protein
MNSQSINAFKRLAIGSDDVKFLVSILARGKGVALNSVHYSALRLLRQPRRKATETSDRHWISLLDLYKFETYSVTESKNTTSRYVWRIRSPFIYTNLALPPFSDKKKL